MGQHTGINVPSEIVLHKGQAFFGQLARGTVLRVACGSVVLLQHLVLEQAHLPLRTTIACGGTYSLDTAMWVEVQAQTDTRLVVYTPAMMTATQLLRSWLPAWPLWLAARA